VAYLTIFQVHWEEHFSWKLDKDQENKQEAIARRL
jgi:hypothetical protein